MFSIYKNEYKLGTTLASHHHVSGCFYIMATAHAVDTAERSALLSASDPELPAIRDGLAGPDETTPLLRTDRARLLLWNGSGWWSSARAAASTFSEKNAGLLLVAAAEFFLTGINFSVKWLNGLDKPVPTLEVCIIGPRVVVFRLGTDYIENCAV